MRVIDVARVLRTPGGDRRKLAEQFLGILPSVTLDDAAVLAQRFAKHPEPPPREFFLHVATHFKTVLCADGALPGKTPGVEGAALLADAFAHVRFVEGNDVLGLLCLSASTTDSLAAHDLIIFAESCLALGAHHDAAIRSFLVMKIRLTAGRMEIRDLVRMSVVLAHMNIFSLELASSIELHLLGEPYGFDVEDLILLLPHYKKWNLGIVQKKAFQTLGFRLSKRTEYLNPHEALQVVDTFASVGHAHEVLLQHLFLRLLLDRSFTQLPPNDLVKLAAAMSRVQHYNTGLLREIVAHVGEEPDTVRSWTADDLSASLRSFGLAPVHVPDPTVRLMGCRYAALFPDLSAAQLRDFFEMCVQYPQLLRTSMRQRERKVSEQLQKALPSWGAKECADAVLAVVLAADPPPSSGSNGARPCACARDPSGKAPQNEFRTPHNQDQLQVVMKVARNWKQRDYRPLHIRSSPDRPWINDEEPPSGNWLLTEGCLSSWALPGRKSRRLPEPDYVSLLGFVLPQLLRCLHKSSGDVAELIGAVSAEALLLGEVSPALGDSTLAIGTELHGSLVLNGSESDLAAHNLLSMSSHITTGKPPLGDADAHASSQKSPCLVPPRGDVEPLGGKLSDIKETENMRRSEVLQLSVQVFATLQLCTSLGALPLPALPLESYRVLGALAEMVGHQLRPRRGHEDPMAEKWCMGPQRLEAFVRRPEEPMQEEVFKTTRALMPFLPDILGWAEWDEDPNRRFARLHGEPGGVQGQRTGGALISIQREVEVPPFVLCVLLTHRKQQRLRHMNASPEAPEYPIFGLPSSSGTV